MVADRLKLPLQKVLEMPVSHFNLWVAYLKKEQNDYNTQKATANLKK